MPTIPVISLLGPGLLNVLANAAPALPATTGPGTLLLSLALGFAIGASLGLLGGGGSILTVPALVYLVGQPAQIAVATSLAIVGANSAMGAWFHWAHGTVNWRVALLFGGTGMVASYLSAGLSKLVSPTALLIAFALLMLTVGTLLLLRRQGQRGDSEHLSLWKIIISGAGVGLLTGFLGVGGGFLIVPALVMLIGLPIHKAVGTSLVVIAMNSAAGLAGHLNGLTLDWPVILTFVGAGLAGTFTGARFGKRLDPALLRRAFGVFVIGLAIVLLVDNVPKLR